MDGLLSKADRALGRLDGVCSILPNPDLFREPPVLVEETQSGEHTRTE
jgi:hypothetical protein